MDPSPPSSSPDANPPINPNTQPPVRQVPDWKNQKPAQSRLRQLGQETQLNWRVPRPLKAEHVGKEAAYIVADSRTLAVRQYPLTFLRELRKCMIKKTQREHGWDEETATQNVDNHLDLVDMDDDVEVILDNAAYKCYAPARDYTTKIKGEIDELGWDAPTVPLVGLAGVEEARRQGKKRTDDYEYAQNHRRVVVPKDPRKKVLAGVEAGSGQRKKEKGDWDYQGNRRRVVVPKDPQKLVKAGQDNLARFADGVSKSVKNADYGRMANQFGKAAAAWIGSSLGKPSPGMKWATPGLKMG
ncbi:MAG: class II myosin [Watsoniomyces obsoletus]|nr:MAG: class II myosin [Watsoniomyces obsoletus]